MRIRSCFLLVLSLGWGHGLSAEVLYSVTDLGTLGGTSSGGSGINNAGQVVGGSSTSTGSSHAFLYSYSNGQMQDLGTLGGDFSNASGINNAGQVTGTSGTASGASHAFAYSNGQMLDLGTLPGYSNSAAYGINDNGQIVGYVQTFGYGGRALLFSGGQIADLGVLPGDDSSRASSINNSGQVAGTSEVAHQGVYHAFLFSDGKLVPLTTVSTPQLDYRTSSQAWAVNNAGQVTGIAGPIVLGSGHAFLYTDGQMTDLGTLPGSAMSTGLGINDAGQVVGAASGDAFAHAFLYSNGQLFDLNNLIDPALGITLNWASAINDQGQIVANGQYRPNPNSPGGRAFLLTPVPEPSTFALFGVALLGLSTWARVR